jgi:hypothetical protein
MTEHTARQTYDPYRLIEEVAALLRDRSLDPDVAKGHAGDALGGAGMLLRAFGIAPLMDSVDAYKLSVSKVWSEEDGLI